MNAKYSTPLRIYNWEGKVVSEEKFIKLAKENWTKKQIKSQLIFKY